MKLYLKTALLCTFALAACTPDAPVAAEPITSGEVRRAVQARSQMHVQEIERAIGTLERTLEEELVEPAPSDLGQQIAEKIFADSAIESQTEEQIVFRANPALLCEGDVQCIQMLTQVPVRFVVSETGDLLTIRLEIGAARHFVGAVSLDENHLTAELHLAAAREAALALLTAAGEDTSLVPSEARGSLRATLEQNGDDYTFNFAVAGAVHVVSNGSPSYSVDIAQAARAANVHLSADGIFEANADFGSILVSLDGDLIADSIEDEAMRQIGAFVFSVAGVHGYVEVDEAAETIHVEGASLGNAPATITADGARVFSFSSNARHNHTFDLDLIAGEDGLTIDVTPALDLIAAIELGSLMDLGLGAPEWMRSEELRLTLDQTPSLSVSQVETGLILQMISGNMSLSSRARSNSIVASGTSCWAIANDQPDDSHPLDLISLAPCE